MLFALQVRAHAGGVGVRASRDDQFVSGRVHLQERHTGEYVKIYFEKPDASRENWYFEIAPFFS